MPCAITKLVGMKYLNHTLGFEATLLDMTVVHLALLESCLLVAMIGISLKTSLAPHQCK